MDYIDNISAMRKLYFSPDSPRFNAEIQFGGIGIAETMPPSVVERREGTQYYLLVHFHDANHVECNRRHYDLEGGESFLWKPGMPHAFGRRDRPWSHSWILARGERMKSILEDAAAIEWNRPLKIRGNHTILPTLEAMYGELLRHPQPDLLILESYCRIMVRKMERAASGAERAETVPEPFLELRQFMEDYLHRPLTLDDLAERVHLSRSHFCVVFRRYFDVSPMHYLMEQRLSRALVLLEDRALSIKQVADKVGFEDALYFSRQFRRHHGVSPSRYRQKAL